MIIEHVHIGKRAGYNINTSIGKNMRSGMIGDQKVFEGMTSRLQPHGLRDNS